MLPQIPLGPQDADDTGLNLRSAVDQAKWPHDQFTDFDVLEFGDNAARAWIVLELAGGLTGLPAKFLRGARIISGDVGSERVLEIPRAALGAPGERGKAADHGISAIRHVRLTQPREARRPSPKGRDQPRASRRQRPCAYDLSAAAAPSLRCIAADLRRGMGDF